MPAISIGGIATGLPPNLVDQLIEAERIPIKNIEAQKGKQENRLKLVTELETKLYGIRDSLGTLASSRGFNDMKLFSGDPNIVQGSVDPETGANGSWNIEVLDLAQKAAAITNGWPDKDKSQIGVGYFRFYTADGYKEVYINGSNNTLQGAANAINSSGLGVKASVINDRSTPDEPFKLMISGVGVGGDNRVRYPKLYFLDGDYDMYFEDEREAKNGVVKVDGFEFEIDDNKVEDIIPGVVLDLKQAAPGRQVNVSVKEDMEVVVGKVKTFVDAMNGVLGFIQKQNALTKDTDTTSTLGGDSLLRSIERRFQRLIQDPQYGTGSSVQRLSEIGIRFNRNGLIEFNEEAFNKELRRHPVEVQKFLAGDGFSTGFISGIKREVGTVLNTAFGPLAIRKKALQDKISQMDDRITQKERQLLTKEESLKRKFAKLEETVSRLKSQGGAISGALGAPSGVAGLIGG